VVPKERFRPRAKISEGAMISETLSTHEGAHKTLLKVGPDGVE